MCHLYYTTAGVDCQWVLWVKREDDKNLQIFSTFFQKAIDNRNVLCYNMQAVHARGGQEKGSEKTLKSFEKPIDKPARM